MGIFVKNLTCSSNSALSTKFKIPSGMIKKLTVLIPDGCVDIYDGSTLITIKVYIDETQIFPQNRNEYFKAPQIYSFEGDLYAVGGNAEMKIDITNSDTANDHTPVISFYIEEGFERKLATTPREIYC